jgi:hypothetical protein
MKPTLMSLGVVIADKQKTIEHLNDCIKDRDEKYSITLRNYNDKERQLNELIDRLSKENNLLRLNQSATIRACQMMLSYGANEGATHRQKRFFVGISKDILENELNKIAQNTGFKLPDFTELPF